MDIHIGEMTSTVRATDSQALLSPELLEKIVNAVIEEFKDRAERDQRHKGEYNIQASASSQKHSWE